MKSKTRKAAKAAKPINLPVKQESDFVRERRYMVVKISDAKKHLTPTEFGIMELLAVKVATYRRSTGKRDLCCVVVESDWPEYEPTWLAIEERMTAKTESKVTMGELRKHYT